MNIPVPDFLLLYKDFFYLGVLLKLLAFPPTPLGFPQLVKNPPAMQQTLVQFVGWEDVQEKG